MKSYGRETVRYIKCFMFDITGYMKGRKSTVEKPLYRKSNLLIRAVANISCIEISGNNSLSIFKPLLSPTKYRLSGCFCSFDTTLRMITTFRPHLNVFPK